MQDYKIQIEEIDTKGKAFLEGDTEETSAEMTYSKVGDTKLIIDHTVVGEALRGKGIGKKLLMAIVEKARAEQKKILPLCPFAKSVFEKDTSIRDVL